MTKEQIEKGQKLLEDISFCDKLICQYSDDIEKIENTFDCDNIFLDVIYGNGNRLVDLDLYKDDIIQLITDKIKSIQSDRDDMHKELEEL